MSSGRGTLTLKSIRTFADSPVTFTIIKGAWVAEVVVAVVAVTKIIIAVVVILLLMTTATIPLEITNNIGANSRK